MKISEDVNSRNSDNAMTAGNRMTEQIMTCNKLHTKLKMKTACTRG